MRRISLSSSEVKRIRTVALLSSIIAHVFLFAFLLFLRANSPGVLDMNRLTLRAGGSGGGGGGGPKLQIYNIEFGPSSGNQLENPIDEYKETKSKVKPVPREHIADVGTPVIRQDKKKKKAGRNADRLYGANLPIKHHRGTGPGAGGGMGGGTGGGIGKSSGSSIDWGGTGERRLLSGSIPSYPQGTNKEMPVFLQFTVLPDGSVSNVIPLRKSDELLERAAIAALRTWRFDPLPSQVEQKEQVGKITFNFKLEL